MLAASTAGCVRPKTTRLRATWLLLGSVVFAAPETAWGAREGVSRSLTDAAREPQRFPMGWSSEALNSASESRRGRRRVLRSLNELQPVSTELCFPMIFTNHLFKMTPLFVASMRANRAIASWILVHFTQGSDGDDALQQLQWPWLEWPPNLQVVQVSAMDLQAFMERKLGVRFAQPLASIDGPKLNDWKHVFGHLFEDWIGGCRFWGYSDLDLIYGRLDMAVPATLRRSRFDVISPRLKRLAGPFTLFRNTARVNKLYQDDTNWETVVTDWSMPGAFGIPGFMMYDEIGMTKLVKERAAQQGLRASFGWRGKLGFECSTTISVGHSCSWDPVSGAISLTGKQDMEGGEAPVPGAAARGALFIHVGDSKRHTEASMTERYCRLLLRDGLFFTRFDATLALLEGLRMKRESRPGKQCGTVIRNFEHIGLGGDSRLRCRHLLPPPAAQCAQRKARLHELRTLRGRFCVCPPGWCASMKGQHSTAKCVPRDATGDPLQDRWKNVEEAAPWPHGVDPAITQSAGALFSVYRPFMNMF